MGTRDAMVRIAGRGAEQVDVHSATILSGLVDTHPHLMHFGTFAEPLVDIADARSHDDIVERIRARAADTPAGEWIMTTPVGEPHYFLRRSWRNLAEGSSLAAGSSRGYQWFGELASGKAASTRQIAVREGLSHSYVRHVVPLGLPLPR